MYLFDHNERANSNSVRAIINQLYTTKNELSKVAFVNREHVNANLRKAVPILVNFYAKENNKKDDDRMEDHDQDDVVSKIAAPEFSLVLKNLRHSIAYWNVLSQDSIDRQSYMHCSPEHLSWGYRRKKIIETIPKLQSDILCLQGVDHNLGDIYFGGNLNEQYLVDSKIETGFSSAIFFNKRLYQMVKSTSFPMVSKNGSNQYAHLVLLQTRLSSAKVNGEPEQLVIVNTSLSSASNHSDHRVEQSKAILQHIKEFTDHPCHVILTGEFFDDEHSPIHNYLVSGSKESKPLTCIREKSDYIWYSQNLMLVGAATYNTRGG
eukprot:CAMPEP_0117419726 /NCGR_PEP_ID=MMETSP0758-20121206/1222_1 /TAXON_ID=63605 /ORGANISM="Percolomonas cosmopolitus, Strain AE-1 (ATCC 50343)" /LENGTH=319 /DNA_ID=CAMNT_0005200947 /DNA_START=428 /DNA_END=1384 /DNA_ORIENTATION=-